jgi:hypothetical protein
LEFKFEFGKKEKKIENKKKNKKEKRKTGVGPNSLPGPPNHSYAQHSYPIGANT